MTTDQLQLQLDTAIKPPVKKRIWELDFIRGFCVILMVIYHFLVVAVDYTREWYGSAIVGNEGMAKVGRFAIDYLYSGFNEVAHPFVIYLFIMLCGVSCGFSRSNLKRGLQLAVIASVITLATTSFVKGLGIEIRFGILHLLSACILIWTTIQILSKNNKKAMLIAGIVLFFIIVWIFAKTQESTVYANKLSDKIIFLTESRRGTKWSPADFFPIVPWSGVFFAAAALSPFLYPNKESHLPKLDGKWNKPICFIGRHALLIYCAHTVFFVVLLELIGLVFYDGFVFI